MGRGVGAEPQLLEHLLDMGLDGALGHESLRAMALFDRPSATSESTSRSRAVNPASGSSRRCLPSSRETIVGSITVSPSSIRRKRIDKDGHVEDTFLQEIPDLLRMLLQEPHRITRLDVLRQDQDADPGVFRADPGSG